MFIVTRRRTLVALTILIVLSFAVSSGIIASPQAAARSLATARPGDTTTVVLMWSSVATVHTTAGRTLRMQIGLVGYTGHCCSLTVGLTTSTSSPVFWQDIEGSGLTALGDDWCIAGGICWLAQTGSNPENGNAIPAGETHDWTFRTPLASPTLWPPQNGKLFVSTGQAIQPFGTLSFQFTPLTNRPDCGGEFHTGNFSATLDFSTGSKAWGAVRTHRKVFAFPKGSWEIVFPSGCQDFQG